MTLSVICPNHGGKLTVADHLAGKKIKCPKCAAIFEVDAALQSAVTAEAPPRPSPGQPAGITPEAAELLEADEVAPIRPLRIRRDIERDPTTETVATIIPFRNARALIAYYCAVFSVIPCAGLVLGPIAFLLGILGMRYVRTHPSAHGTGHALVGIILGGLTALANWGIVIAMLVSGGMAVFGK